MTLFCLWRCHCPPTLSGGFFIGNAGENQRAIEDLNEAVRLDPQLAFAFANRALAYTYLGRDLEAQRDTKRGIELGLDRGILESAIQKAQRNR